MTLALYVPRTSWVHRAAAGVKLLALAALSALVFTIPTLPVVVGALGAVVLLGLVAARLPAVVLGRQARAVLWWLVALFVLHSVVTDVLTGALTVLRLLTLVLAAAVVTATTRVTAMVAFIERVCRPLRWLGVRPARIGLVIAMALRFIPLISERAHRIREAQAARGGSARGLRGLTTTVVPLLVQVLQLAATVSEALDARGADDVPVRTTSRCDEEVRVLPEGRVLEIWLAGAAAEPMRRVDAVEAVAGRGLSGDRYALGGGTWARYPDLEKQVTLIDRDDVAAVAADTGSDLTPEDTRRNLVTTGLDLPALVGRWFAVGDVLLFGMKRCPPCTHLERLTGVRLVKAMVHRGGINAAVFAGGVVAEGSVVRPVSEDEAARRGAPTGADRPVPRVV